MQQACSTECGRSTFDSLIASTVVWYRISVSRRTTFRPSKTYSVSLMRVLGQVRKIIDLKTALAKHSLPIAAPASSFVCASFFSSVSNRKVFSTMVEGLSDNCWNQGSQSTEHAALSRDLETDVCIVGAGIAGLTTAYRLAVAGMDNEDEVLSVTCVCSTPKTADHLLYRASYALKLIAGLFAELHSAYQARKWSFLRAGCEALANLAKTQGSC